MVMNDVLITNILFDIKVEESGDGVTKSVIATLNTAKQTNDSLAKISKFLEGSLLCN